ncbi:MAG: tetratricopeptide (TPR) repeat protein [Cellvibrionaceae bacterium]
MICSRANTKKLTLVLVIVSSIASCSYSGKNRKQLVGATLSDLPSTYIEPTQSTTLDGEVTLDEVEKYYQRALDASKDPGTRRTILVRLADILMLRSEENMLVSEKSGRFFDEAIDRYRELIQLQKQAIVDGGDPEQYGKELDQMLYQLSKAYALDGRVESADKGLEQLTLEYQDSTYSPEAKFRRAEQAFSNENYEVSEQLYKEVIDQGTFTPFYQNAIYMRGWSQFKNNEYDEALIAFIKVLDHLFGDEAPIKEIPDSQKNLVDDTLRVMSLSFTYMNGEKTLSEKFAADKKRPYIPKLYRALGQLYFSKKRYRDSANTYRQYVIDNPLSDGAPLFSGDIIDVYEKGDFPSLLIPAKEEYVNNYGIDSEFWQLKPQSVRDALSKNLKVYLEELAKYEHATGQRLVKDAKQNNNIAVAASKASFLKAASWYDQFIRTFPEDKSTAGIYFLMAEALNDAGEFERAFNTYRLLAYQYSLPASQQLKGADAGYSAIVLAQKLEMQAGLVNHQPVDVEQGATQSASAVSASTKVSDYQKWQNQVIEQSLAFADKYSSDKRAASVLSAGAEKLLQIGRQPEAILAAKRVTQWQPPADTALQRTSWLVIGQSEFDLANYKGSEEAYAQALVLTSGNSPDRQSILDRQAASIYKYAEGLLAEGQQQSGVVQLLRVQEAAPNSSIAITAQYDAGNQLMAMKRWSQAENIILRFRQSYPSNPLTKTLYAKLVVIYQETQQWLLAGNELTAMASVSDDPVLRRQSLLLSAELYEKSGQITRAITNYNDYIKRYPEPLEERMEAMNKLSLLYKNQNNIGQYEYWLKQLIVTHDAAGNQKTERSLYLAASAFNYQAQKDYLRFVGVRLTLPLKNSLRKKQSALTVAVVSYQKVIDYGVAEFVTEANYYLGETYVRLSSDVLKSERPKGLSALAKDQYDVLLEEQVYPFEEKAIELHKSNVARTKSNLYDEWVKLSFASLAKLSPGRFNKQESRQVISELY